MQKKLFIVFEGIDGSGKSTQAKLLYDYLKQKFSNISFYKFPTHQKTKFGKIIDEYLYGKMGKLEDIPPEIPSLLYALDRYQFKNELEYKKIIICDRYWQSNLAHQAAKLHGKEREKMISWLIHLDERLPKPSHIFLIDVPVKIAYKRIMKEKKMDIHEKNKKYLEEVRKVYLLLAKKYKWNIINGIKNKKEKTKEEIFTEVKNILKV
ncbi:MAG: dTMP kinase [Candidatus Aenigmatarchaeota archaeon]